MKKLVSVLLLSVLALSVILPINVAVASNTTLAEYVGTVRVTNTGATTTNVFTVFNLTTQDLIDGDFVWDNVTNTSMLTNGGADIEYMPAPGATIDWAVYIPSILLNGSLDYRLYIGGEQDMEGEIRYFPASGGMTTADSATLELGNNFTVEQEGYVNTTFADPQVDLAYKEEAFITTISAASQITSGVYGTNTDFQSYTAGAALNIVINAPAGNDAAQTFTTARRHYIDHVRVEIQNPGLLATGDFIIGIRAVDGAGAPTGADLTSVTVDSTTVPAPYTYIEYELDTRYPLAALTQYALVMYSDPANPLTNQIRWDGDPAGTYAGGQVFDPLTPPTAQAAQDAHFHEWGYHYAEGINITSGDKTITTTITDAPTDLQDYASDAQFGVSVGNGLVPAMILERQQTTSSTDIVTFGNVTTQVALWDSMASVTSRHLVVLINAASDQVVNNQAIQVRLNGDSGANYYQQRLYGTDASDVGAINLGESSFNSVPFDIPGDNFGAFAPGGGTLLIPHAFNTVNHKAVLLFSGSVERNVGVVGGRWADTAAITSVEVELSGAGDFAIGSEFILAIVDERYLIEEITDVGADFYPARFSAIPQFEGDLALIGYVRSARAVVVDQGDLIYNGDAVVANYWQQNMYGSGGAEVAASVNTSRVAGIPGDTSSANTYGAVSATIYNYTDSANDTRHTLTCGFTDDANGRAEMWNGRWNNVAAITQIDFNTSQVGIDWKAGTLLSLYQVPQYVISRQELGAPAATITFNSIPQGYEALALTVYARSDLAALDEVVEITFNTDAVAANYDFQTLVGTGAIESAARNAASQNLMLITAANEGANEFGGGNTLIFNYAMADRHKHFLTISGTNENQVIIRSSRWEDLSPITRIDLDLAGANNFIAGTVVELVGYMPTSLFALEVDGVIKGSEDADIIDVIDNANNWAFVEGNSFPWLEEQTITIDGVLQQQIAWENDDTTFTDASGQGHDASPTFRTASSDVDVSAFLITFLPVSSAVASNFSVSDVEPMIIGVVEPSELFNETVVTTFPGTPFVEDVMADAGIPATMFYIPIIMLSLVIIGLVVGKFSLLAQLIVMSVIIFALAPLGVPAWIGLLFLLDGLAFVLASKQFGW